MRMSLFDTREEAEAFANDASFPLAYGRIVSMVERGDSIYIATEYAVFIHDTASGTTRKLRFDVDSVPV